VGGDGYATADDLVADAQALDFPATRRLITDWVRLGLLDHPGRRSLGRGRGQAKAVWPPNQRRLFQELAKKRPTVAQLGPLFNMPVYLWLSWGDDYVPLRQARRALATWAGKVGRPAWRQCMITAKQILAELDHAGAHPADSKALVEAIATVGYTNTLDREALLAAAKRVADPNNVGSTLWLPGPRMTPDGFVHLVEARTRALADLAHLSDTDFQSARRNFQASWHDYVDWRQHQSRPRAARLFASPPDAEAVNNACVNLLTLLGLQQLETARK
jgi:hypothetical protein